MKKMYIAIIPYIIIIILVPLLFLIILNYNYQISRYITNKKNPHKILLLEEDLRRALDRSDHIDFRDSFKEDFDRIIVVDLKYDISDFNSQYNIKFDEFEIEFSEDSKKYLRKNIYEIGDFQLVMFFENDKLIRYQELLQTSGNYHFLVNKSKEYKETYVFMKALSNKDNRTNILAPYKKGD